MGVKDSDRVACFSADPKMNHASTLRTMLSHERTAVMFQRPCFYQVGLTYMCSSCRFLRAFNRGKEPVLHLSNLCTECCTS